MLNKLFESLYNKVIISIVIKRASTDVYIELCSRKEVLSHVSDSFDVITPNRKMIDFINKYIKESPYHYIALLDISLDQGAIASCEKGKLSSFYDLSLSKTKCYDKKWTYYTSKTDIVEMYKMYKPFELDFLFSPFVMLSRFFEDKINSTMAMFILIQDSFVTLAIFDNGQLLYGDHLDMETAGEIDDDILSQTIVDEIDMQATQDGIDLEDIDVIDDIDDMDDIDSLDDFGDIEDLDALEEIDEFSENRDIEEEFYEADEEMAEEKEESFNEDYQRFSLIQSSLGHYYNNEKYDSKFIESVYISDGVSVSADLKRYLEEEMFLNVYIRQLSIGIELAQLVKEELGI